jgi:hypothetical protein
MFLVVLWLASLASAILSSCEASVPSHCTHLGQQSSYGWTFGLTEPNRSFLHVLTDISYLKLGTHWFPKVSRLSSYMHSMLLTLACIWCECTLLLRSFCDASRQFNAAFFFWRNIDQALFLGDLACRNYVSDSLSLCQDYTIILWTLELLLLHTIWLEIRQCFLHLSGSCHCKDGRAKLSW